MECFSRSGGTLLNRCLGSLPNVVVMSEVNLIGGGFGSGDIDYSTVKAQSKHWYGIDLSTEGFVENILELYEHCKSKGLHLIIRDFTYLDFVPSPLNNRNVSNTFMTIDVLKDKVDIKPFAFVRNPIDSWISFGANKHYKYFKFYRNYVESIIRYGFPYFKYEDFCTNPEKIIDKICTYTGIDYSESYKNFNSFNTVNGDVAFYNPETNIKGDSRGLKEDKITSLPRKRIDYKRIFKVNRNKDMIESNKLLGYPTNYYSSRLEEFSFGKAVKRFFKIFTRK